MTHFFLSFISGRSLPFVRSVRSDNTCISDRISISPWCISFIYDSTWYAYSRCISSAYNFITIILIIPFISPCLTNFCIYNTLSRTYWWLPVSATCRNRMWKNNYRKWKYDFFPWVFPYTLQMYYQYCNNIALFMIQKKASFLELKK